MSGTQAKAVKEDISRATGYARRFMPVKALRAAAAAFDAFASSTAIMGRAKFELEILLQDMLRELELLSEIRSRLRGPFSYTRGNEKRFALALAALALLLQRQEMKAREAAEQERLARIETGFAKASEYLASRNLPAVRRTLNTVCELNETEPGIHTRAAALLAEADLHPDALTFAEKALGIDPKDARAFGLAVEASRRIGELPKAESLLREALKTFGAHPRTYVSLAKVLYQMGRWEQAYDAARSAQDRDPSLEEAREIVALTEKRVMG